MAMKPVKYYVVDAFTEFAFKGNPAAVCFLEEEKGDDWLQAVAREFNISQTCFLRPISDPESLLLDGSSKPRFHLRWFTPVAEVRLCGHATLAAAYVLFSRGLVSCCMIEFSTLSGILTAKKVPQDELSDSCDVPNGDLGKGFFIELDFPIIPITQFDFSEVLAVSRSLNDASIVEIKKTTSDDLFVLLQSAKAVEEVVPHLSEIQKCPGRGVIITGPAPPGSKFDFFSRFFCPKLGINEDPVCGSAHCALAPYWSKKLGKCDLVAYQASPRSGILNLHVDEKNQRVLLQGKAVTVMEGCIWV